MTKITPIALCLSNGFAAFGFKKEDVDGKGINKQRFEETFPNAVRFAYSQTSPGLVVVHVLDVKLDGAFSTTLKFLKFFHPGWGARRATGAVLRNSIEARAELWNIDSSKIDDDIAHLMQPPHVTDIGAGYERFMAAA